MFGTLSTVAIASLRIDALVALGTEEADRAAARVIAEGDAPNPLDTTATGAVVWLLNAWNESAGCGGKWYHREVVSAYVRRLTAAQRAEIAAQVVGYRHARTRNGVYVGSDVGVKFWNMVEFIMTWDRL